MLDLQHPHCTVTPLIFWADLGQVMLRCCAVTTICLRLKHWRVKVSKSHASHATMMCYHTRLSETETLECQSIKSTHLLIALCKHIDVELVAHDQQGLNCSVFLDCNGEAGRIKGRLHVHNPALTFRLTCMECSQSCMPASTLSHNEYVNFSLGAHWCQWQDCKYCMDDCHDATYL